MSLALSAARARPAALAAPNLSLTELSRRSGLTARVLKYYEEVGLLDPPRPVGNSRIYLGVDLHKISVIARLRSAGVEFAEIAEAYRTPGDEALRDALATLVRRTLERLSDEQRSMGALLTTLQD